MACGARRATTMTILEEAAHDWGALAGSLLGILASAQYVTGHEYITPQGSIGNALLSTVPVQPGPQL
jgi:hypothetical protein